MCKTGKLHLLAIFTTLIIVATISGTSSAAGTKKRADPHYTASGFFDIHLCNWPNRSPFYMVLYSTEHYDDIKSVDVMTPDNKSLGSLDLEKFKPIKRKDKPDKRVFISQIDASLEDPDGWFSAKITLKDGATHNARDFVIHYLLPRASDQVPANHEEDIAIPSELKWGEIEEAAYYQVFIRDLWNDGELIYSSKLLEEPTLKLPEGLIRPGGFYAWKIHARDVNEHAQLGDFNIGSNSEWVEFTVAEE